MPRTLAELIDVVAERRPKQAVWSMPEGERRPVTALRDQAHAVAGALRARGVEREEVVGFLLHNSLDVLAVILGIWRAGAAVAPLPAPASTANLAAALARFAAVASRARIRFVVSDLIPPELLAPLGVTVVSPGALLAHAGAVGAPDTRPDHLAVVQFTSGSTAAPKGVALTHAQALTGIHIPVLGGQLCPTDTHAIWLPLSHDFGFVSTFSHLLAGADVHLSTPGAFIRHPDRWLAHFARIRATTYVGPAFGYAWMRAAVPADEVKRLDLSAWRLALNGAEVIVAAEAEAFLEHFAPAGLQPGVMLPAYGLAEATVGVAFPRPGTPLVVDWVRREGLVLDGTAEPRSRGAPDARGIVSIGGALPGVEVRLVGADGREVPERIVGELEVRGASVMRGYHGDPDATAAVFHDGWLRTGDLAYVADGRLYVAGRMKDVIKLRGEGIFPDDLEARLKDLPGVHRRRVVAFGVVADGTERAVALLETERTDAEERAALLAAARSALGGVVDADLLDVRLVAPRRLEFTTSGKPQRQPLRRQWAEGTLTGSSA